MTSTVDAPAVPVGLPRAQQMLDRARWAARAFAGYDRASVVRIAEAVAAVAEEHAEHYARWAVRETGSGVAADKVVRNQASSRGILALHRDHDLVTPRIDHAGGVVEVPRPRGVVLALVPRTDPVATVYAEVLLAVLTRNAVLVSPHPLAPGCSADAARVLAEAAVAAGAPDGVVQVVEQPSAALADALARDDRTDLVLASAGPGNVPVLVDGTADVASAAAGLVASQAFDGSLPATSESVLVVVEAVADRMLLELQQRGAHLLDAAARDRLRDTLFPHGRFDESLAGVDAEGVAVRAGVRVAPGTRVLLAPVDVVLDDEPLAHPKPCPVLAVTRVPTVRRGLRAAAAVVRIGGTGQSAVVHSTDARTVVDFCAALDVLRVTVNDGGSTGAAASVTVGTGVLGHGSPAALHPDHLVHRTVIAQGGDTSLTSYEGVVPGSAPSGPVPAYPVASNLLEPLEGRTP